MLGNYEDISSRINEPPKWWDSHGVPRYENFCPNLCPNVYAQEVMLLAIRCQACQERFLCEINSWSPFETPLHRRLMNHSLHYGDPPRHGGCGGETMTSDSQYVVEFWRKDRKTFRWSRVTELEWTPEGINLHEQEDAPPEV